MRRHTLIEYIDRFHHRGSQIAYIHRRGYRTVRWSYREIAEASYQFARELEARGIGKKDRVMIWGENCPEWVVAFFGCLLRGVVTVPMDHIAAPEFVRRVYSQVDARLLVGSSEHASQDPSMPTVVFETMRETLKNQAPEPRADVTVEGEDVVEIIFTSGTTAEPKGVVITHRNILANLEPIETEIGKYIKYERIFHPLRFLNLLPLSHVFGQFLGIFVPQLIGGIVIFQKILKPSEIIRTIKRERVSVLVAVPRLLETLRDKIERDFEAEGRLEWFRRQFRAAEGEHFIKRWWRFRSIHHEFGWKFWAFVCGGATLDSDTEAFWGRLSFVVIQGYGLTETTSLVSLNHPFRLGKGSIGKILPGREIKLDETGEILVRGENIAAGYWQNQETKPVEGQQGWFHTGDVGELDEAGNLYFKGRKKNVIVTAEGMNVYPEDLEAALRRQPEIHDCVVIGLNRQGNAFPCAVLLMRDGSQDAESAVRRANESLAEFQRMHHWFVWPDEDFPRTSTQKPKTNEVQEWVRARLEGQAQTGAPAGTLAELVGRVTGRAPPDLSSTSNLTADLALTSIDRVELLGALEDRYQIDLNETKFTSATTVGELEQMIRNPIPRRSDYRYPRWTQHWPMNFLRIVVYYILSRPATMLMARPRIRGRENLRGLKGPVLVIANHITQIDVGFILAALPPRLRHRLAVAMLGEMLQSMRNPPAEFGFLKRWFEKSCYALVVALFNVFPLPQQTGFRESFSFAGESADRGYSILVFPEGRRTLDGKLQPFRSGIGMLALNLNLPIVPIRIDGLFELKQSGKKFARPGTVTVTIGAPVRCEPGVDAEALARHLEERMASL